METFFAISTIILLCVIIHIYAKYEALRQNTTSVDDFIVDLDEAIKEHPECESMYNCLCNWYGIIPKNER